ncbi:hypothetical protein [Mesorhizobium sp. M1143]|uniref:hypothetical protein n=1 Tax=Mesorhizobium sp. M1143 TaxID=2957061 RepID=UPI0033381671
MNKPFNYCDPDPSSKYEAGPSPEGTSEPGYFAWAVGPCFPVFVGSSGVTVSGWEIRKSGTGELVDRDFIASRNANRREWEGTIMGIAGVCEMVPAGSVVLVKVRQKEMAEAYSSGFLRTSGKPMAGQEFWSKLLTLIAAKSLRVSVEFALDDAVFESLREDAKGEGIKQFDRLGEDGLRSSAKPPKAKRLDRSPFEAVEGEVDQQLLISRRRSPARRKGRAAKK